MIISWMFYKECPYGFQVAGEAVWGGKVIY